MLGFSHATSGALGWFVAAPVVSNAIGMPLTPQELGIGAVVCAGAALIPDLDHPQATIAWTFGPISRAAAKLTALLAGGHRQGTHSLLFALGFGAFCYLVGTSSIWWHTTTPAMVLLFMLAAFAFRGLNIVPPRVSGTFKGLVVLLEALALTLAINFFMPQNGINSWWWMGLAGAMGAVIHLIGDTLTPEGVPWFYPARWRASIPIISHTGNVMERAIIAPLMMIGVVYELWIHYGPSTWH